MATASSSEHISIRRATPADAAALRRLARLDSATVPAGEVIVADIGGELRAAVGVADGRAIADPFYETKLTIGRYYIERVLPETSGHLAKLKTGSDLMMKLPAEAF